MNRVHRWRQRQRNIHRITIQPGIMRDIINTTDTMSQRHRLVSVRHIHYSFVSILWNSLLSAPEEKLSPFKKANSFDLPYMCTACVRQSNCSHCEHFKWNWNWSRFWRSHFQCQKFTWTHAHAESSITWTSWLIVNTFLCVEFYDFEWWHSLQFAYFIARQFNDINFPINSYS